jgi:hypothetical protein
LFKYLINFMYKNLKSFFNSFCLFFRRIFNRSILNKVIFIFTFGLLSRAFINNINNVNVFSDYMSHIFVIYYSFFSLFIVIVPEFINIISSFSFISVICNNIVNILEFVIRMLISMNIRIFHYKLEDIKISSISSIKNCIKYLGYFSNRDKVIKNMNSSCTSLDNHNTARTLCNESEESINSDGNYDRDSDATISDTESNRVAEFNRINKLKRDELGVEADKLRKEESIKNRRARHNERNKRIKEGTSSSVSLDNPLKVQERRIEEASKLREKWRIDQKRRAQAQEMIESRRKRLNIRPEEKRGLTLDPNWSDEQKKGMINTFFGRSDSNILSSNSVKTTLPSISSLGVLPLNLSNNTLHPMFNDKSVYPYNSPFMEPQISNPLVNNNFQNNSQDNTSTSNYYTYNNQDNNGRN